MIVKRVKQWLQGDLADEAPADDPHAVRVLMVCMGNIPRPR